MKDYSKVKYVKPSVDGRDITQCKVYSFDHVSWELGCVYDDKGVKIYIYVPECPHLKDKHWIPCDENGKEIEL